MGELADKRLADLLPTIDAYRPVALATAAVLGLTFVLPGAEQVGSSIPPYSASDASSVSESTGGGPATQPADTGSTSSQSQASASPSTDSSSGSSFTAPRSEPRPSSSGPSSGGSSEPSPSPEPAAPAPSSGSDFSTDSDSGSDEEPEPLSITEFGWASSTSGTPLSDTGVPDDTLPVGTRVGQDDKVSFIRLSGDETQLVLTENEEGRRGNEFDVSPVQVCRITDAGWEAGGNQSMSDAPEWDAENCVALEPGTDSTWSANLFIFGDPTDERGFAIVPSPDAPIDFQVTFGTQTAQ